MIALHGFNDYSNFIAKNADFFNGQGIAVYAYDQRGFGKTPFTGRWSGTEAMARDLAEIVPLIRAEHPGLPLFLLGDSMGGAVVIVTMTQEAPLPVEGVILVAPAVWARSTMPFYQRWLLAFAAHVMPWGVASGSGLEITPSDNKEMLRELGQDPLVIKESRFDTLYGLADLMDAAYGSAKEYNAKTLLLYGRKDEIIPEKPVMEAFHNFNGQQRLVVYENGYHMLLRDLQAEAVMNDIAAWLANPATTALPSSQSGTGQEVTGDDSRQSRNKISK
jgi:alpha-beta hydrolase superfamily lysophospholipase